MKLEPIAVIAILSLVAASLLVTGCTTSTTSNTNQTASSSHDATLSQLVNSQSAYFNNSSPQGTAYPEFQLTWLNDTAVRVAITGINSTNQTQKISELFLAFKTTNDATTYVQSIKGSTPPNADNYSELGTSARQLIPYEQVTGHAPTVFTDYTGNSANDTAVWQYDNVVVTARQA
jgi:hypothetical protein